MFCPLRCKAGPIRHYEINESGVVRCSQDHEIPIPCRVHGRTKKYKQVQLMIGGGRIRWLYVHRLMGYSWLFSKKHECQNIVDHIDGNSLNNSLNNLRWVTACVNNLNKSSYGLVRDNELYMPRIMGFTHARYATKDEDLAQEIRTKLLQCYIRYGNRYPQNKIFPHNKIHKF